MQKQPSSLLVLAAKSSAPAGSTPHVRHHQKSAPFPVPCTDAGCAFHNIKYRRSCGGSLSVQVADRAIALGPAVAEQAPFHTSLTDGCKVIACSQDGVLIPASLDQDCPGLVGQKAGAVNRSALC